MSDETDYEALEKSVKYIPWKGRRHSPNHVGRWMGRGAKSPRRYLRRATRFEVHLAGLQVQIEGANAVQHRWRQHGRDRQRAAWL